MTVNRQIPAEFADRTYWMAIRPAEIPPVSLVDSSIDGLTNRSPRTLYKVAKAAAGVSFGPFFAEEVGEGELLPRPDRGRLEDGGFGRLLRVELDTRVSVPTERAYDALVPVSSYRCVLEPDEERPDRLDDRPVSTFNRESLLTGQWLGREVLYLTTTRSGASLVGLTSQDAAAIVSANDWPPNKIAQRAVVLPRLTVGRRHTERRRDGAVVDTIVHRAHRLTRRQALGDRVVRVLEQEKPYAER
jgi:hypothetical protein